MVESPEFKHSHLDALSGWIHLYKPPNKIFPLDASVDVQSLRIEHAMWNPLCTSTFVSYMTYFQLGCLSHMSFTLQIVLHLYNAFRKHSFVVNPSELSLLLSLDTILQDNSAIWESQPPPDIGSFVFAWWKLFGGCDFVAQQKSDSNKSKLQRDGTIIPISAFNAKRGPLNSSSDMLRPESVSKNFRMLCFESTL